MLARNATAASSWLLILISSAVLSACAKPPAQPTIEQPPPEAAQKVESAPPPLQAREITVPAPPTMEEVQEAVKRVFKDAVAIEVSRNPAFLVGDFNGDQSQDLAAILKPAEGKLADLNQEFPNWIAREPLDEVLPKSKLPAKTDSNATSNPAAGQTIRFEKNDLLLAIIHGFGALGWRDPEATQTHLLRGVVGKDMSTMTFKAAENAYGGIRPFPSIYGDLIQQTLLDQSGFLHYNGGMYGWYDRKNYRPATAGPRHSMTASMGAASTLRPSSPQPRR